MLNKVENINFWPKEKLLIMSNFTFAMLFKSRLLHLRQNASAGGKGLTMLIRISFTQLPFRNFAVLKLIRISDMKSVCCMFWVKLSDRINMLKFVMYILVPESLERAFSPRFKLFLLFYPLIQTAFYTVTTSWNTLFPDDVLKTIWKS